MPPKSKKTSALTMDIFGGAQLCITSAIDA